MRQQAGLVGLAALAGLATAAIWPYQTFKSVNYTPPVLSITKSGDALADGYLIFSESDVSLTNPGSEEYAAPLIMTDDGELIWNGPEEVAANVDIQTYQGESVLTYWVGNVASTDGYYGHIEIYDSTYTLLKSFCPDDLTIVTPLGATYACYIDLHEGLITDWDTIVFTVTNVTQADLTSVGGPAAGWVYDCLFFEYDLSTGEQLFRWSAIEHIPVNQTQAPWPTGVEGTLRADPWAWFHMNAVDPIGEGEGYLTNSRFMWASYRISSDGDVLWSVNGYDGGNFTLPSTPLFAWQHDSRIVNITDDSAILHYFNNFNSVYENGTHSSNALYLQLDLTDFTVTVLDTFVNPEDIVYSTAQGNHDILENGNHFVEYGVIPHINEFGPDGDTRLSIQFGYNYLVAGYRAHRKIWSATPATKPDLAVSSGVAYFSWNGATDVGYWKVYTSALLTGMKEVAYIPKTGFETNITVNSTAGYIQVSAYDSENNFLRNSSTVSWL